MSARTGLLLPHALRMERRSPGRVVLFDENSTSRQSNIFEVRGTPIVLRVYNARNQERIDVMAVFGPITNERQQPFRLMGEPAFLDAGRNAIVLRTAGRYRLELLGIPGEVLVVAEPQLAENEAEIPQPSTAHAHRPNLFLNGNKLSPVTKVIEVADKPWVFNAYGLTPQDHIEVWITYGWGSTFREEPYLIDDIPIWLTQTANAVKLETSGRYRFKLVGQLGDVVLVGNPTTYAPAKGEPVIGIPGHPGQDGEPGPQGPPGTIQGYTHEQPSASQEWIVNHNLGFKPSVELLTVGGMEFDADIVHLSTNQLRVYTTVPMSGTARLT